MTPEQIQVARDIADVLGVTMKVAHHSTHTFVFYRERDFDTDWRDIGLMSDKMIKDGWSIEYNEHATTACNDYNKWVQVEKPINNGGLAECFHSIYCRVK